MNRLKNILAAGLFLASSLASAAAIVTSSGNAQSGQAVTFLQDGGGAIKRTMQEKARDFVSTNDFCAPALADKTACVQAAINYAALVRKMLYIPQGSYLLSGAGIAIPQNFPGIRGEGIYRTAFNYTGTGTAISFPNGANTLGTYSDFSLDAGAVGETVAQARLVKRNGIYWRGYGGAGNVSNIMVRNFNGYGQKIEAMWDTTFQNMMVVSSGNADEYAFSTVNGTDTTNHSTITRLQVELSYEKAVYLQGLNLMVTELHSERTTGNGVDYTHVISGDVTLMSGRIEASSNVWVKIGIANGAIRDLKVFGRVDVSWGARMPSYGVIENCVMGDVVILSSNLRKFAFKNTSMASFSSAYAENDTVLSNSSVAGNVTLTGNGVKLVVRDSTEILGSYINGGGNNTIELFDAKSTNLPTMAIVKARNTQFSNPYTTLFGQKINITDSTFGGLITIANSSVKWSSNGNNYAAGVALGSGSPGWKFGPADYVSGGTFGAGLSGAPLGGDFVVGERTYNLAPAVGQPKSRVNTVLGTPGTWVSEGNL